VLPSVGRSTRALHDCSTVFNHAPAVQRGIDVEDAVGMIISGFCREVRPAPHACLQATHTRAADMCCRAAVCCMHDAVGCHGSWLLGRLKASLDSAPQLPTTPPTPHAFPVQVFNELPLEFAAEVNQLMSLKLEGSVG